MRRRGNFMGRSKETEKQQKIVEELKGHLKNDRSMKEAAESMKISTSYAYALRKESIKNNTWLTEEEIEEIQKRKEEKKRQRKIEREKERNKKQQKRIEELKEHLKNDRSMEEAAKSMGVSISYAYAIRRESVKNNTWLTEEEMKEIQKRKEEKKRQRKIEREKERNKKQQKIVEELRGHLKNDRSMKEAAESMEISISSAYRIRKERIQNNTWITQEEIEETQKREEKEKEKVDNREKKRKMKEYKGIYKKYKKLAKKEQDLELDGEQNVKTEGRKKFIEIINQLHKLEGDITNEDLEIVLNIFHIHPELAEKESIKVLIAESNQKGGLLSVQKMIREMMDGLRHTKFYKPLVEYEKWTKRKMLYNKIKIMKKQGMDHTTIGRKLGITSAEVSVIFHSTTPPDFFDFEGR